MTKLLGEDGEEGKRWSFESKQSQAQTFVALQSLPVKSIEEQTQYVERKGLPTWARILIAVFLALLLVFIIVGSATANWDMEEGFGPFVSSFFGWIAGK